MMKEKINNILIVNFKLNNFQVQIFHKKINSNQIKSCIHVYVCKNVINNALALLQKMMRVFHLSVVRIVFNKKK